MKRLILSAAILAFAGLTTVQAREIKNNIELVSVHNGIVKTPIKLRELPKLVVKALKKRQYAKSTPVAVFSVKDGNKSYFQVNMKKDGKITSLKFNKDGKKVDAKTVKAVPAKTNKADTNKAKTKKVDAKTAKAKSVKAVPAKTKKVDAKPIK